MRFLKLVGGILVIASIGALLCLGIWQVQRLHWKQDLLTRLADGINEDATVWNDGDDIPEFSHVTLTGGALQVAPALLVYGRTVDGVAGAHMIALYRMGTGRSVIVDRGFLPLPIDQLHFDFPANKTVDGILREVPSEKAWFDAKNNQAKNEWYWMDLPVMAAALGSDDIAPIYVEALTPTGPNGPTPTADHLLTNLPNNHLQYAITWFGLAGALTVMYTTWLARSAKRAAQKRKAAVEKRYGHAHNPHPHFHEGPPPKAKPTQPGHHGAHLGDLPIPPDRRKTPRT